MNRGLEGKSRRGKERRSKEIGRCPLTRLLCQRVHMFVVIKLAERQQLISVVLVVTCEVPQIPLQLLGHMLSLAIGLWVISHQCSQFDPKLLIHLAVRGIALVIRGHLSISLLLLCPSYPCPCQYVLPMVYVDI
jgi:hypothetical protein